MPRLQRRTEMLKPEFHWWHRLKLSTQKFAILLSVMAVALGFTYVWMTNSTAASGFAIDDLQRQLKQVQDENERLELTAADLRALSVVQVTSQNLALEPTDRFEVLPATPGPVAIQR